MTPPGPGPRPRILLVGPMPPTRGGVTTFMLNLMASPLAQEFEFVPFTTSRPPKRNVTENWGYGAVLRGGPRRIVAGMLVTLWHMLQFPFAARRADLVQVQASDYLPFWEAGIYALGARLIGRPVLFRIGGAFDLFHAGATAWEHRLIAWVLRLPTIVIAQSQFARCVIRKAGRDGPVILLPNWSAPPGAGTARGGSEAPVCLFIAGSEAVRKGAADVLAAAAILRDDDCRVRFHLLAVPPRLAAEITALGLPGVTMEGPVSHAAVLASMQRCDIFLLPSRGEGFPNSLVEAMAAGMACVASPVGAIPEMATGGGIVTVAPGDPVGLAATIRRLAASSELRSQLGAEARQIVQQRYTAATALPALAEAYRSLAPRRRLIAAAA